MTQEKFKSTFENAETVDGWPEPDMKLVKGYRAPPPLFPVDLLGDFWMKWLIESAESKSAPVDYVAAALLTSCAALIGNSYLITPWAGWSEPPIFWACGIGNPSDGKTPAINAVMDLMRDIETSINPDFKDRCKDYERLKEIAEAAKESWKSQVKNDYKNKKPSVAMPDEAIVPEKPLKRRFMVMDTTVEIIAPILSKNPKGILCYRDELAGWLGSLNQYKGGSGSDRPFYLEAYNGKPYTVDRVKFGLEGALTVPRLSISILGGIQPDKFAEAVLSDADDGLSARFTYFYPEPVPPKRPSTIPFDGLAVRLTDAIFGTCCFCMCLLFIATGSDFL